MKQTKIYSRGFTMIELLIALAIVGILTLVAYPSYQDSVLKSRRSDGIAAALGIQVAQERFRGSCRFYAGAIGANDVCGANPGASTVAGNTSSNEGYYTLSISGTSSGNAYTILVSPTGSQTSDTDCNPMQIAYSAANPLGLKTPADCW